ncbi:hypothetical protein SAMN02745158_03740 [Lactonifactor longoviformis DSM 17459]|uniref:Uncharacterized protein n=1 Tax=Lactonifactor longoviformis DSM 17459 TaxID=1122155 RepID=A0A1M5BN20_9CLOT|nr:hypothetical protein SAMN02745158_03740 [Lactonifactor longoviformis DSM 17459]
MLIRNNLNHFAAYLMPQHRPVYLYCGTLLYLQILNRPVQRLIKPCNL